MKIHLNNQITYQIKVPGEIQPYQIDTDCISITHDKNSEDDRITTTFTCQFDQAGLQGFLRALYAMGLPLISVKLLEINNQQF